MIIDTSSWKEFRVGDLFELVNSKPYHTRQLEECDSKEGIRYITRTMFNNGLKCYVKPKSEFYVNPKGTISFGAENADFFYQNEPYITGNKMYYIDTQEIPEKAALFLKSILQATFAWRFSFSEGMVPARIKDEIIKLPITSTGEPDWKYMEEYMGEIMEKADKYAAHLSEIC